uniref:uncharacterized protein LOC122581485 n=1 Tax=Erigeron canadensis TaxID=72917 RepID=UPI001CB9C16B|nr:uncharacterized protein LOC122581485 [Erigeron canadensis]
MQRPSPYSSFTSPMKITTPIRNFIVNCVNRVLTKSKSILIGAVEELHLKNIHILVPLIFKKNRNKNKYYLGSFRLHYNWSSSHIVPKSSIHNDGFNGYCYYDISNKWNSFEEKVAPDSHLSGYLHWLEEKNVDTTTKHEIVEINEIDDLAEKFIANCRGKFMLEKQESDRKFQEMMARSL